MMSTNFIPAPRRALRRQRRRQRVWTAICAGYAAALIGLSLAAWLVIDTGGGHAARLGEALTAIDGTRQAIDQARNKLAPAQAELLATESISARPDWSILLAQIASRLADDVFLSSVTLDHKAADQPDRAILPTQAADSDDAYVLTVGGYGRTQAAVSDFVVELESTPLFKRISILQTNRQKLMADEAVRFELSCLFGGQQQETR